ncbi:MAG: hypothetical protein MUE41_14000 [Gemmatimonadaceae bacterium]|jgi:Tfp pilus assembly protein PilV|nr:hypothetical protein [Gemmatimonadaceae bacterium]
MTLLEAMVALAIVAMVAVGGYELTATSARAADSSSAWTTAVREAESLLDAALVGAPVDAGDARVARAPYRPGLDVVIVDVPVRGGGRFALQRIVPALVGGVP